MCASPGGKPRPDKLRGNRRWWLGGLLTASVSAVLVAAAFALWLIYPPKNEPARADVVVVVAGSTDGRHELGALLTRDGVADNLVVSNPAGTRDRVGYRLCHGEGVLESVRTWCLDPVPVTTTGEARSFEELARREGWNTAVVVTNRPHHHRVRLNFERCTSVETTVVSIDYLNWRWVPYQLLREAGGYLKFWVNDPC